MIVDSVDQAFERINQNQDNIEALPEEILQVPTKDIKEISDLCGRLLWEIDEGDKELETCISKDNSHDHGSG